MVWWCPSVPGLCSSDSPSVRPSGSPSVSFPHFSPTCFDILSWNRIWLCFTVLQIKFECCQFLGHRSRRLQWPIVITRCPASVVCRLASVVCRLSVRQFTFSTSSPEPLDGFWWNLVWMKYSRSLTSVVVFWPDPPRGGSRARQK